MNLVTVTGNAWGAVITGSTVDTILQSRGAVRLCFGPSAGVPLTTGIDADDGYQIIVPAGVDVSAVAVGQSSVQIITGPFGV